MLGLGKGPFLCGVAVPEQPGPQEPHRGLPAPTVLRGPPARVLPRLERAEQGAVRRAAGRERRQEQGALGGPPRCRSRRAALGSGAAPGGAGRRGVGPRGARRQGRAAAAHGVQRRAGQHPGELLPAAALPGRRRAPPPGRQDAPLRAADQDLVSEPPDEAQAAAAGAEDGAFPQPPSRVRTSQRLRASAADVRGPAAASAPARGCLRGLRLGGAASTHPGPQQRLQSTAWGLLGGTLLCGVQGSQSFLAGLLTL
ncbi:collagen alpha-1(I) chain-like [Tyto alba]|uniref:collagen alpha-1(I) chain-like n=1 Tax=Tyto alba TaxID=56313 RepID=UPI001C680485|nr:collagen alpha-1(I) chain-like [Tyto alba]